MTSISIHIVDKLFEANHIVICYKQIENIPCELISENERILTEEFNKNKKESSTLFFLSLPSNKTFCHIQNCQIPEKFKYLESIRILGHQCFKTTQSYQPKNVLFIMTDFEEEESYAFLEGFFLSTYKFDKYKSQRNSKSTNYYILKTDSFSEQSLKSLQTIVQFVFTVRDWTNEPASSLTPVEFANQLSNLTKQLKYVSFESLTTRQIESLKMSGLIAISSGTSIPPKFIILDYNPPESLNSKPFVLIGKGIFFDTGGINLKTATNMSIMKYDMTGAAIVAAIILAAAKLNLQIRIVGLIPATENRPGPNACLPGNIITMMNGKTVEIVNTDAEGRLIIADALCFASKYNPELILSIATLTGSAHTTFGPHAIAAFCHNTNRYFELLTNCSFYVHERIAQLPLWDDYDQMIKSDIADFKNSGDKYAGAITAARFLVHFVNYPFIHLDIAGPAYYDKSINYIPSGGTGIGVRLLLNFFSEIVKEKILFKH